MKLLSAYLIVSLALAGTVARAAVPGCGTGPSDANGRSAQAGPKQPSGAAIATCTKIASPAKRLDCYDALTGHAD